MKKVNKDKNTHISNPSTHQRLKKLIKCDTMECYLALERKEILIHVTMWMNLEDIMLSKKEKYSMIPLT